MGNYDYHRRYVNLVRSVEAPLNGLTPLIKLGEGTIPMPHVRVLHKY